MSFCHVTIPFSAHSAVEHRARYYFPLLLALSIIPASKNLQSCAHLYESCTFRSEVRDASQYMHAFRWTGFVGLLSVEKHSSAFFLSATFASSATLPRTKVNHTKISPALSSLCQAFGRALCDPSKLQGGNPRCLRVKTIGNWCRMAPCRRLVLESC
jgi:hypothetical protein